MPTEVAIGEIATGALSWLPQGVGAFAFDLRVDLIDSTGQVVMTVLRANPTVTMGIPQATPVSVNTTGLSEGWYGFLVVFSDLATGVEIGREFIPNALYLSPAAPPVIPEFIQPGELSVQPSIAPIQLEPGQPGRVTLPITNLATLSPSLQVETWLSTPLYQFAVGALSVTPIAGQATSFTQDFAAPLDAPPGVYGLTIRAFDPRQPGVDLLYFFFADLLEILPPPPVPPPPPPPPIEVLGVPIVDRLPTEVTQGEVWSGAILVPQTFAIATIFSPTVELEDIEGTRFLVTSPGGMWVEPGLTFPVDIVYDTSGLSPGRYNVILAVDDLLETVISTLDILALEVPALIEELGVPIVQLPTEVTQGELWSGAILMPHTFAIATIFRPTVELEDIEGTRFLVTSPGNIWVPAGLTFPVDIVYDTSGLSPGRYNVILAVDTAGYTILETVVSTLDILDILALALPTVPQPGDVALPSISFSPSSVEMGQASTGAMTLQNIAAFPFSSLVSVSLVDPTGQSVRDLLTDQDVALGALAGQSLTFPVDTTDLQPDMYAVRVRAVAPVTGITLLDRLIDGVLQVVMPAALAAINEFTFIHYYFDGGTTPLPITKFPGRATGGHIVMDHRGAGGAFKFGYGIAAARALGHGTPFRWVVTDPSNATIEDTGYGGGILDRTVRPHLVPTTIIVYLPDTSWPTADLAPHGGYDALKTIEGVAGEPYYRDWDDDVFTVPPIRA